MVNRPAMVLSTEIVEPELSSSSRIQFRTETLRNTRVANMGPDVTTSSGDKGHCPKKL
jgi:hypothetical protein